MNVRSSKFGPTLVISSTEVSGSYILGFRIDPIIKLYSLHKELISFHTTYNKSPIFGVESTFEHQVIKLNYKLN
jgi:Bardet-Biedl syndrome 5 protein